MTITHTITHHNHLSHFVGKLVQKDTAGAVFRAGCIYFSLKRNGLISEPGCRPDAHAMVEVVLGANRAVIADNDTLQDFAFSSDGVVVADNCPIDVTLGANRVVVP